MNLLIGIKQYTTINTDVHLIMREGGKEATNRNAFNWQSTYAILKLEAIIKNAKPVEGENIFFLQKIWAIKKRTNTRVWLFYTTNLLMKRIGI